MFGFGVLGFWVYDLGSVLCQGLGIRVYGLGFRGKGLVLRA